MNMKFAVPVLILLLLSGPTVWAETMTFQEDADSAGYQAIGIDIRTTKSANPGETKSIYVGRIATDGTDDCRGLVGFDISAIPAGSTINSVSLTLVGQSADTSSSDKDFTIELYELVGSIEESKVTWAYRDVDASVAWTTAGGDYQTPVLSSVVDNPKTLAAGDVLNFTSSTAFVSAAQGALDGSGTLYMLARATSEDVDERGLFRLWGDDPTAPEASCPSLSVDYTPVPEPATWLLCSFAMLGLLGYGLRKKT